MAVVSQEVNINIVAQDRASAILQQVKMQLEDLQRAAQSASIGFGNMTTATSRVSSRLQTVQRTFRTLGTTLRTVGDAAKTLGNAFIATPLYAFSRSVSYLNQQLLNMQRSFITLQYATEGFLRTMMMGLVGVAGGVFGLAANYQRSADAIALASTMTEVRLEKVRDMAFEVATTVGKPVEEVANAIYMIGSAGIRSQAEIERALKATAAAAVAGGSDMQQTFQTAIGMVNAFKDMGYTLQDVYAKMFKAMKQGLLTFEDMATYFGVITPAANQLGASLDEALGAFAALTKMGLLPARAATATQMAFQDIFEKADKLKELGINIYDAQGRFRGLYSVIKDLADKMAGMTDEGKRAVLETIGFEVRATRAIINWINRVDELKAMIEDVGSASAEAAEDEEDAFVKAGQSVAMTFRRIQQEIQRIIDSLMPTFNHILLRTLPIIQNLGKWAEKNLEGIFDNLLNIGKALLPIVIPLKVASVFAGDLFQMFYTLIHIINPFNIVMGGMLFALYQYLSENKEILDDLIDKAREVIDKIKVSFIEPIITAARKGDFVKVFDIIIGGLAELIGKAIVKVAEYLKEHGKEIWKAFTGAAGEIGGGVVEAVLEVTGFKPSEDMKGDDAFVKKLKEALGVAVITGVTTGRLGLAVKIASLFWLNDVKKGDLKMTERLKIAFGDMLATAILSEGKPIPFAAILTFKSVKDTLENGWSLRDVIRNVIIAAFVGAGLGLATKSPQIGALAFSVTLYIISEFFPGDPMKRVKELKERLAEISSRVFEKGIPAPETAMVYKQQVMRELGSIATLLGNVDLSKVKNIQYFSESLKQFNDTFATLSKNVDRLSVAEFQSLVNQLLKLLQQMITAYEFPAKLEEMGKENWFTNFLGWLNELYKRTGSPATQPFNPLYTGGGHQAGGYTADIGVNKIAGVVHGGEWVAPAWMVKHPLYGALIAWLEQKRIRGFQGGGSDKPITTRPLDIEGTIKRAFELGKVLSSLGNVFEDTSKTIEEFSIDRLRNLFREWTKAERGAPLPPPRTGYTPAGIILPSVEEYNELVKTLLKYSDILSKVIANENERLVISAKLAVDKNIETLKELAELLKQSATSGKDAVSAFNRIADALQLSAKAQPIAEDLARYFDFKGLYESMQMFAPVSAKMVDVNKLMTMSLSDFVDVLLETTYETGKVDSSVLKLYNDFVDYRNILGDVIDEEKERLVTVTKWSQHLKEFGKAGKNMANTLYNWTKDSKELQAVVETNLTDFDKFKTLLGGVAGLFRPEMLAVAAGGVGIPIAAGLGGALGIEAAKGNIGGVQSFIGAIGDALMGLMVSLIQVFGPLIMQLENVQAVLFPFQTILQAIWDVLGPVINQAFAPLATMLKIIGTVIGNLLLPVLQPLLSVFQLLANVMAMAYNMMLPGIRILYILASMVGNVFKMIYNAFASFFNWLADQINNLLGWAGIHIGHMKLKKVKSLDEIMKEAEQKFKPISAEGLTGIAMQTQAQYTANVSRTGPETVNIYFQNSIIYGNEEVFKEQVLKWVKEWVSEGVVGIG
ncbi:MAG TPA: phage tail tape measure protein [Thermotogaceae bacterium]|nr:phage tail tape measure protein [Thermotogaceae bacterium]